MQFSHYLDLVEVELLKQISTQSKSFFAALSRLHSLREEVTAACEEVTNLRQSLGGLELSTGRSLEVITTLQKQENIKELYTKVWHID